MLHEILLSLSGHPSPLLQSTSSGLAPTSKYSELLSPPEAALLSSLAHLSSLHQQLLRLTESISSSHPSTICRAASAAIVSTHLARFQKKILEVERGILSNDASLVGGYGIVPLSRVVGEFEVWIRPMEWLWNMARFMQPVDSSEAGHKRNRESCSGAAMMDKLREEAQTGYPDLEEIALDLVQVTETAWLRQLSTWVLYGRLPAFGAEDFMIALVDEGDQGVDSGTPEYAIVAGLMPKLVTSSAASSILFVGRSLNHIRAQGNTLSSLDQSSFTSPELALLPAHLRHLSALSSPISSSSLSSAISAIRASLSKNMLQQLLPLPKILDILSVLRDYFLLERGEFAIALITEADEHLKARWRRPEHASQDQASDKLTAVLIKEGEVTAVLARTWATLSSFHAGDDEDDDADDLARDLIDLSISKSPTRAPPTPARSSSDEHYALADVQFNDLLLSTPTTLSLYVSSPLDLFITPRDLDSYTAIHSYLLSIRRGHLKLTHLWKRTTLRRDHPSPLGPPHSNTSTGQASLQQRRARANARARGMRKVWATSSAAAFLLAEVGEYFQGQVVKGSWKTFLSWLDTSVRTDEEAGTRHETAQNRDRNHDDDVGDEVDLWTGRKASSSDPRQAPSAPDRTPHDPETLSRAHRLYLSSLTHALFLTDLAFTSALRAFLRSLDHLVACVARVDAAQKTLDLETDSGVVDTDVDGAVEERRAMRALLGADEAVHADLGTLLGRLRELDGERSVGSSGGAAHGVGEFDGFVPWRSGGVDRLCMKLDFGSFVGG